MKCTCMKKKINGVFVFFLVSCRSEIMGDKAGPSDSPYFNPDKATENYIRLSHLITTICGSLMRHILCRHIEPVNLRNELDINRTKLEKK